MLNFSHFKFKTSFKVTMTQTNYNIHINVLFFWFSVIISCYIFTVLLWDKNQWDDVFKITMRTLNYILHCVKLNTTCISLLQVDCINRA